MLFDVLVRSPVQDPPCSNPSLVKRCRISECRHRAWWGCVLDLPDFVTAITLVGVPTCANAWAPRGCGGDGRRESGGCHVCGPNDRCNSATWSTTSRPTCFRGDEDGSPNVFGSPTSSFAFWKMTSATLGAGHRATRRSAGRWFLRATGVHVPPPFGRSSPPAVAFGVGSWESATTPETSGDAKSTVTTVARRVLYLKLGGTRRLMGTLYRSPLVPFWFIYRILGIELFFYSSRRSARVTFSQMNSSGVRHALNSPVFCRWRWAPLCRTPLPPRPPRNRRRDRDGWAGRSFLVVRVNL